jgi:hypothetical protein
VRVGAVVDSIRELVHKLYEKANVNKTIYAVNGKTNELVRWMKSAGIPV